MSGKKPGNVTKTLGHPRPRPGQNVLRGSDGYDTPPPHPRDEMEFRVGTRCGGIGPQTVREPSTLRVSDVLFPCTPLRSSHSCLFPRDDSRGRRPTPDDIGGGDFTSLLSTGPVRG